MSRLQTHWISYASTAIFATSQAALFVLYPYVAERMGLELFTVIACFSAGSILFLVGGPAWSWISVRRGAGFALRCNLVGLALSQVLLLIPIVRGAGSAGVHLALLVASRAIYGLGASGIVPVTQAILVNHSGSESRMRVLATHGMVLNAGRLLGPLAGTLLVMHSPALLFILPAALSLTLAALPYAALRPATAATNAHPLRGLVPSGGPWRQVLGLGFVTTAMTGILQSNLAAYLQAAWQLSAVDAASHMARLLIFGTLSMLGAQLLLRRRSDHGRKTLTGGAWLVAAGFICLLGPHRMPLLYVAVFLISLGMAWLTPSYTAILSLTTCRQEAAAGTLSAAHKIGYASGGLMTAAALRVNTTLPFVVAAALALVATALVHVVQRAALRQSSFPSLPRGNPNAG